MAFVKNPNYNPNDPKSQRYIEQVGAFTTPSLINTNTQTKTPVVTGTSLPTLPTANSSVFTLQNLQKTTQQQAAKPTATPAATPARTTVPTTSPAPAAKPATPAAPTPTGAAPAQPAAPAYDLKADMLQRVYSERPDLQALYNPDGTPKNPNDPKIASIPTLQDWAQQYGVKERPEIIDTTSEGSIKKLAAEAAAGGLSVEDFLAITNAQATPTADESNAIRNKLGIPNLIDDAFSKPAQTTVQAYKELYELAGLTKIKDDIKTIDGDIAKKRADLVTATEGLNNNPWLSQASRTGRMRILNELALADINNSIAQKNALLDQYDTEIGEIEATISRQVFDEGLDRDLTVDKLNFLLTEAEREEELVSRTVQQRALRYVPEFLQGVQQREKDVFNRELQGDLIRTAASKAGSSSSGGGRTGSGLGGNLSAYTQSIVDNPALFSQLTPTEKGKILSELANAGVDPTVLTVGNLNAGQREQVSGYDDLLRSAAYAKTILDDTDLNTGLFASQGQRLGAVFGGNKDFTQYRSAVDNMNSQLLLLRSGAAVTDAEFERIKGFIPSLNDDEKTAKTKIENFVLETSQAQRNYVLRATQTPQDIIKSVNANGGDYTNMDNNTFFDIAPN